MIIIDARDLPCPAPTVQARNAIKTLRETGGVVQVQLNNPLAAENLERMAIAAGHMVVSEQADEHACTVTITVGKERPVTQGDRLLLRFATTKLVLTAERSLRAAGLAVEVLPMPEELPDSCGIVLALAPESLETSKQTLAADDIAIDTIYRQTDRLLTIV